MVQLIMTYTLQAVFFVVSLILYVLLTACILPKVLLTPTFSVANIKDRGIRKYLYEEGRAIVYQPATPMRPYIPQYILSQNNQERFLQCKLNPQIGSVKYRVLTFDRNNRPLQALEVEDPVATVGLCAAVPLPMDTAFVSIRLTEVNGTAFRDDSVGFSKIKLPIYLVSTIALTIAIAFPLQKVLLYCADLLFGYSQIAEYSSGAIFSPALVLGTVYALLVVLSHRVKGSKLLG